jgi:hypothetical protein
MLISVGICLSSRRLAMNYSGVMPQFMLYEKATESANLEAALKAEHQFHITFYSSCLRMKRPAHVQTICEWVNWLNLSPRSNAYNFLDTTAVYLTRHVISIGPTARPLPSACWKSSIRRSFHLSTASEIGRPKYFCLMKGCLKRAERLRVLGASVLRLSVTGTASPKSASMFLVRCPV